MICFNQADGAAHFAQIKTVIISDNDFIVKVDSQNTVLINRKGEIIYAYLEPDYKKRAAPETIIETLSKIKSSEVTR